ncbi:hypothetical protein RRG08_064619 [Elysia crispata]|uniref:Uncharacterized protein n=1 Tax=Elysia crispata TaxID=231223 RepID=A0AAE1BAW9_9GAST|nr:hypothetical protein RRG08_064619 [Elysia crispata]
MSFSGDPHRLLQTLQEEIVHGSPASAGMACRRLETAQVEGWLPLVEEYRLPGPEDSLLHLAALFQQDQSAARLLRALVRLCPGLLVAQRGGEYLGQTALHIVISKGNLAGAAALLSEMDNFGKRDTLLNIRAVGSKFAGTVMDGELALHVAALSLNKAMVDLLLEHNARLDTVNSLGDTVMHALVRFAGRHPDRTEQVIEMLDHLHIRTCKRVKIAKQYKIDSSENLDFLKPAEGVGDQLSVWFVENNRGLTPLKLAAYVGAGRICSHILSLDGVYRLLDTHDGLFDTHLYDITELDPVTNRLWQIKRRETTLPWPWKQEKKNQVKSETADSVSRSRSKIHPLDVNYERETSIENRDRKKSDMSSCFCYAVCCCMSQSPTETQSVLEIICGVGASQAFCLISTNVVRQVVRSKWHRWRGMYYIWLAVHLLFMVGLTFYAIYRPRIENKENGDQHSLAGQLSNDSIATLDSLSSAQRGLVKAWPWLSLVVSVLYIGLECIRTFCLCQAWHLRRLYHNGLYRLILVVFSSCLFLDSLWYWFGHHTAESNIFLILALLMGGWFLTFFLRAWRKFSFFTILFQKVLMGDMFRFSIMILLELLAFSVAMYVAYLPTSYPPGLPEEFEDIWTSILTMFRLMLGLSDVEILSKAPAPWMAVTLYVLFVLLTYVLLLNSLIAMMSQTCALVCEDPDLQWHMQRLSVLLMLETLLPLRFRPLIGQHKLCRRYSMETGLAHQEGRYLMPVTSVQANYTNGKAILRRQNLVRTMGFGELTLKLAPSHTHTYSSLSPGYGNDTKATIQRVGTITCPENFHTTLQGKLGYTFSEEQESIYLGQTGFYNNVFTPSKVDTEPSSDPQTPIKINEPQENKRAGIPHEKASAIHFTSPARRRHNSERKNRRTQTESDGPLSRSYPDGMLRNQHQVDNPHQRGLHYLAVPSGPHPDQLQPFQIGYLAPANLLQGAFINSFSNHAATNDIQVPTQNEPRNDVRQALLPLAYNGFDLRVPSNQPISDLVQNPQRASLSSTPHAIPVPLYSQQGPSQAKDMRSSSRVQFVDVNDLSTEA